MPPFYMFYYGVEKKHESHNKIILLIIFMYLMYEAVMGLSDVMNNPVRVIDALFRINFPQMV